MYRVWAYAQENIVQVPLDAPKPYRVRWRPTGRANKDPILIGDAGAGGRHVQALRTCSVWPAELRISRDRDHGSATSSGLRRRPEPALPASRRIRRLTADTNVKPLDHAAKTAVERRVRG